MRNMNDFESAFGEADDSFRDNVYRTLASLQKGEERIPLKKTSFKLIVAIVVLGILATGTAIALTNTWGILDFFNNRKSYTTVLPGAAEIVQTNPPQEIIQNDPLQETEESGFAIFSVREAIYDSENIFIVVEAAPVKPEYLLLGSDAYPSDPIGSISPLFEGQSGTIAEYAAANKKTPIHTSVGLNGMNCLIDFLLEDDGKLVYMISAAFTTDNSELSFELTCITAPIADGKILHEEIKRSTLTVTLKNSGTQESVASNNAVEYAEFGVRVDKVTLTKSPMAMYVEIEYTVIDAEKYAVADGVWFEFLDENGDIIPIGAALGTGISAIGDGDRYMQSSTIRASETLPAVITLRGYNFSETTRYEMHTFEMK